MRSDPESTGGKESAAASQSSFVYTAVPAQSAGEMATAVDELYRAAFAAACNKAGKLKTRPQPPSWN